MKVSSSMNQQTRDYGSVFYLFFLNTSPKNMMNAYISTKLPYIIERWNFFFISIQLYFHFLSQKFELNTRMFAVINKLRNFNSSGNIIKHFKCILSIDKNHAWKPIKNIHLSFTNIHTLRCWAFSFVNSFFFIELLGL